MVDCSSTKLPVELLCAQLPQILDGKGPEMEDVVPGEAPSLLDHHHLCSQEYAVDGHTQADGASPNDEDSHICGGFLCVCVCVCVCECVNQSADYIVQYLRTYRESHCSYYVHNTYFT